MEPVIVLADDVWAGPRRARHKIPVALARLGHPVLWVASDLLPKHAPPGAPLGPVEVEPGLSVLGPPRLRRPHYRRRAPWTLLREPAGRVATVSLVRWAARALGFDLARAWTIVWQDPRLAPILDGLPRGPRGYFASDLYTDHSGRGAGPRNMSGLMKRVDHVLCTSHGIADSLPREAHVIPHGVDLEAWTRADRAEPADLARIPRPRLLFAGVGTVKFDVALWGRVARLAPDWSLVFVGPVEASMEAAVAPLRGRGNVHLLGGRPHSALPGYLAHADVLAMPYRSDPVRTHSGLPNKFYEYLAAGRPILSTRFTEFEDDSPLLVLEDTAEAWAARLPELRRRPATAVDLSAHDYAERARRVEAVFRGERPSP